MSTVRAKVRWRSTFYVKAYQLASDGLTDGEIAKILGTNSKTFMRWKKDREGLQYALEEGRNKCKKKGATLQEYIYKRLPLELKRLWKELMECQDDPNSVRRMEALFAKHGEDAQKHLFIHALVCSRFNPSRACTKVGISKNTLDRWIEQDLTFSRLVDEVHFHKKNFCDEKLMQLVAEKDPAAVLFVNRTLNKDRGYGEKTEIEVTGTIDHQHKHSISIDDRVLALLSPKATKELFHAVEAVSHKQLTSEPVQE